ncbi:MAG: SLC13 family permease [Firmicutes bacterium]|nr:SLC13 family permease [Bacillota bacterium]
MKQEPGILKQEHGILGTLRPSYLGTGLLVLLAVMIMIVKPFSANLNDTAQLMVGGVLITLSIWVFKPFNLSLPVGGLFLACFALVIGLKPATVFSGFTQAAIWTLVPALFFGYTLQKTGLGKRLALAIIKLFKPSYGSLVLAMALIGLILSVLTPSITVRVAIVVPIAVQCCELCNIKKGSKGNSLIILTAFAMSLIPGNGWLTGSLFGPIISGMINSVPENHNLVTFNSWFNVLFVPMILTTILSIVGSLLVLKPKEKLPADAIDEIKKQPKEKMTRHEIITGLILLIVFIMFITSRIHHIPDAAVCLAAVFLFFLFGVLEPKDFNLGVSWDLVVLIAMSLSLSAIFTETGISAGLATIVIPALAPIATNPWLFMFTIMIFVFLWRFFDVAAMVPTMAILVPILPAIQKAYHISPLVWLAVFVMAANSFFMAYQNMWAIMTKSIADAGDREWKDSHLGIYGTIYFVSCMISLLVAIPLWINAGLFG